MHTHYAALAQGTNQNNAEQATIYIKY